MNTIFAWVLALTLLVACALLARDIYVERKFRKLASRKFKVVEPLMAKLASREAITDVEILLIVREPAIRHAVFWILEASGRRDLFPAAYFTHEKAAESALVNWLEFPTELGASPTEIKLLAKVPLADEQDEPMDYYVFQYRTAPPHWGFKWMIGVSGPYVLGSMPYDVPQKVFSRFKEVGSISPELEVKWVHENIIR